MLIIGQVSGKEKLESIFEVTTDLEIEKNYNLQEGDQLLAITILDKYRLSLLDWGLIPFWSTVKKIIFTPLRKGMYLTGLKIWKLKNELTDSV